jgi:hypothetical protein
MRPSKRPPFTEAEIEEKWPEYSRRLRFHIDKVIQLNVTPDDVEAWRMALQLAESARKSSP